MDKSQQNSISEVFSAMVGVSLAAVLLFAAPYIFAAQKFDIAPAAAVQETCGNVEAGFWTAIPSTASRLSGRVVDYVSNPSTNTMVMTTNSALATSTTSAPVTIGPRMTLPVYYGDKVGLYFRIYDSTKGIVCVSEFTTL